MFNKNMTAEEAEDHLFQWVEETARQEEEQEVSNGNEVDNQTEGEEDEQ